MCARSHPSMTFSIALSRPLRPVGLLRAHHPLPAREFPLLSANWKWHNKDAIKENRNVERRPPKKMYRSWGIHHCHYYDFLDAFLCFFRFVFIVLFCFVFFFISFFSLIRRHTFIWQFTPLKCRRLIVAEIVWHFNQRQREQIASCILLTHGTVREIVLTSTTSWCARSLAAPEWHNFYSVRLETVCVKFREVLLGLMPFTSLAHSRRCKGDNHCHLLHMVPTN